MKKYVEEASHHSEESGNKHLIMGGEEKSAEAIEKAAFIERKLWRREREMTGENEG